MRYLKTYKLFEALRKYNDTTHDINDILSELRDDGYNVWCESNSQTSGDISIEIWRDTIYTYLDVEWKDIEPTIMRIFDYMESKGYKLYNYHFETATERNFSKERHFKGRFTEYDGSDPGDSRYMDPNEVKEFLESLPDNKIFVINELQNGIHLTFR